MSARLFAKTAAVLVLLTIVLISLSAMTSAASVTKTYAYVTNYEGNSTTIIDTATDSVVATIPTGNAPVGVAVSPDGKEAYVVNSGSNSVSIIDTSSGDKKGDISVGTSPQHVAFAPDGKHAYVTNRGGKSVSVIDTTTHGVQTIYHNSLNNADFIAISPDGTKAYVTTFMSGSMVIIDLKTNTITGTVNYVGANANVPGEVVFSPDGSKAYVVMIAHATYPGDVSVIDTATGKESYNFSLGQFTEKWGMKLSPKDGLLYITDTQGNQVIVSGTQPVLRMDFFDKIIPIAQAASGPATIPAGTDPWALAFTPDGGKLYVTCRDSVTIIDPVSKTVTGSVLIQGAHKGIAIASVDVYAPEPTQGPTALPTQAQPTAAVATPTAVPSPGLNVTATPQPGAGVSPTPVPPAGSDNTLLYVIFGGGIAFFVLVAGRNYQGGKK